MKRRKSKRRQRWKERQKEGCEGEKVRERDNNERDREE